MEIRLVKVFYCIYMITILSIFRNKKPGNIYGVSMCFAHLQWKTSNFHERLPEIGVRILYLFRPLVLGQGSYLGYSVFQKF